MAEIISGLFGVSPELLQQQRAQQDMIRAQQIAQTQRNPIGAAIGLQFGQSLGRGLLGGLGFQDPELQRATQLQNVLQETQAELGQEGLANPELLYTTLANKLNTAGFAKEAALTAIQGQSAIADYRKGVAERTKLGADTTLSLAKAQKELQPKLDDIEVLFNARDRLNKDDPNYQTKLAAIDSKIENEVSNLKLEENVVRINQKIANGTATAEDRELLKSLEGYQTRVKKAGKAETNITVPVGGSSTIDVGRLEDSFKTLVGPSRENLSSIRKAIVVANEAVGGSPTANEQLNTAIADLYQSGKLSNQDIERVANAGSLPQKIVNGISKLARGVDADITLQDKIAFIKAMEKLYAESNNAAVDRFEKVWGTTPIGKETVKAYTEGSRYSLSTPKTTETRKTSSGTSYTVENE